MSPGRDARLRFRIEAALARLCRSASRVLPRRAMLAVGAALGSGISRLARRRFGIALENLRRALPELSDRERRRIARGCFRTLGRNAIDIFYFHRYSAASVGGDVRLEGWEHLERAHARGKGVLLISGHFGHWELTALMVGYRGIRMGLLSRPLDNRALQQMLLDVRLASGNYLIPKADAMKGLMRALRAGDAIAFLIDQDAHEHGIAVPFFGRPASTTTTPARLALRTGAALVPVFTVRDSDGAHRIAFEPEIEIDAGAEPQAEIRRLTERMTERLERRIREHPDHWFWMHRRWKTERTKRAGGDAA